jgi:hypothetical protein
MTKKEHRRRYRLHSKIRLIVNLIPRQRTISVPYGYETQNKYILELINRFHYNFQFHIPIPNVNEIEVNEPEIVTNKN